MDFISFEDSCDALQMCHTTFNESTDKLPSAVMSTIEIFKSVSMINENSNMTEIAQM